MDIFAENCKIHQQQIIDIFDKNEHFRPYANFHSGNLILLIKNQSFWNLHFSKLKLIFLKVGFGEIFGWKLAIFDETSNSWAPYFSVVELDVLRNLRQKTPFSLKLYTISQKSVIFDRKFVVFLLKVSIFSAEKSIFFCGQLWRNMQD